ncbi:MAG TPA: HAMP domain-containing protein, partial [Candidatus Cloacimonetes bacterium]|nr:HAMP domain-containing protein [Candidatus Cloacimonadota bacterium]
YGFRRNENNEIVEADSFISDLDNLEAGSEIVYGNEVLGTIRIYITTRYMKDVLIKNLVAHSTLVILLDIVLVVLMILLLRMRIIKPILELTNASFLIASGDLDLDIDVSRQDELGILSHSFDDMRSSIKRQIEELKNHHNNLEKLVNERTKELYLANEELINHDRMKSDFVVMVSHELRTPLAIFGNIVSNILAGILGKINKRQRDNLMIVEDEIVRLARIITDFLDISKIEAGEVSLRFEQISFQSIISDCIETIRSLSDAKNIELVVMMPKEDIFINVDRDKMKQVMTNLLGNAIKFIPDCAGRIIICMEDRDHEIVINIDDNGLGIPDENIDKIFNRFIQGRKQVGPGAHGTGLGLAITKELIEMHGGRIWVENSPTGGANFRFMIPKKVTSNTCQISK